MKSLENSQGLFVDKLHKKIDSNQRQKRPIEEQILEDHKIFACKLNSMIRKKVFMIFKLSESTHFSNT